MNQQKKAKAQIRLDICIEYVGGINKKKHETFTENTNVATYRKLKTIQRAIHKRYKKIPEIQY